MLSLNFWHFLALGFLVYLFYRSYQNRPPSIIIDVKGDVEQIKQQLAVIEEKLDDLLYKIDENEFENFAAIEDAAKNLKKE